MLERTGESYWLRWQDGRPRTGIRPQSDLPIELLEGRLLRWQLGISTEGLQMGRPLECEELSRLRLQAVRLRTRPRAALPSYVELGPTAPGESELERLRDSRAQIQRIDVLSNRRDDPSAWAALANGFRIRALQRPIKAAIRSVGAEKVLRLVLDRPGAWPEGLLEFLRNEQRQLRAGLGTGSLASVAE